MHFCHNDDGGGASPALPEVEDDEAAGVVAMAMAARLKRGVEIARNRKAESYRSRPSQQGGRKLWSAREQGGRFVPPPLFKIGGPTTGRSGINGRIGSGQRSHGG